MGLAVPRRACLLALVSLLLQVCQAQTDHRSGWLSSIAAQLLDGPGRRLLGESDHRYDMHDPIKLYANKVGPFSNPRYANLHFRTCVVVFSIANFRGADEQHCKMSVVCRQATKAAQLSLISLMKPFAFAGINLMMVAQHTSDLVS